MMKIQLMILMFVVSMLLSSCVVTPETQVVLPTDNVYSPQPTEEYYVVKRGDTLSRIARKYGISDFKIIARQNNLFPPYELWIGQELVIPLSNQPIYGSGIVTPQPNRTVLDNRTPSYSYPSLNRSTSSYRSPSYSRPGCGVQVISANAFIHSCRWFSQCTGVNYVIKNTSPVTRTVTVEYRHLGQIKVLHNNLQILANDLIDDSAYDVANAVGDVTNTIGPQNIIISHCY